MSDRMTMQPRRCVPEEARKPTAQAPGAANPEYKPKRVMGRKPHIEQTAIELNILAVGQAGAGKSTAIEAITGQKVPNIVPGLKDGTVNTARYTVRHEFEGIKYIMHFWDTPGLTGQLAQERGAVELLFSALDVMQERDVHELDAIFLFVKTARMESVSPWITIKEFISRMFTRQLDINLHLIATHCGTKKAAKKLFNELESSVIGRVLKRLSKGRRHFHDIPTASSGIGDEDSDNDNDDDDDGFFQYDADEDQEESEEAAKAHAESRRLACDKQRKKYFSVIRTSTAKPIPIEEMRKNLKNYCGRPLRVLAVQQEEPPEQCNQEPPSSSPEGSFCFARTAVVELADGTSKHMGDLQLGDRVLTTSGAYMPVCAWLHRAATATASFVAISTASTTSGNSHRYHTLRVSPNHFVAVAAANTTSATATNMQFKPAGKVVVGDSLVDANGTAVEVTGIAREERDDGYFAPFVGGDMTLVVDGVVAHVFADVTPNSVNTAYFSRLMSAVTMLSVLPGLAQEGQPDAYTHPLAAGLRSIWRVWRFVSQPLLSSRHDPTMLLPSSVNRHMRQL